MPKLTNMIPRAEVEGIAEDFRSARKVEQYRIGKKALYIPEGFQWYYLPLQAIRNAEESFRVISGGHCIPIREKRPELDLETDTGIVHLQLEKEISLKTMMDALGRET